MKKTLSLILVIVLCLSLFACSDRDSGETNTNNSVENEGTTNSNSSDDGGETTDSNDCDNCIAKIVGEWYTFTENNELLMISFAEDGTALIGEQEYEWHTNCKDDHRIEIGKGTNAYLVQFNSEGRTLLVGNSCRYLIYKNDNYTFVEITVDNWQEYFSSSFDEVFDVTYVFENYEYTNEWGETVVSDSGTYFKKATIKDADNYALCNLLIECSGAYVADSVYIDSETGKITGFVCVETNTQEGTHTFTLEGTEFEISNDSNESLSEDTGINALKLNTILRMKGWIVLKGENNN